MAGRSPWTTSPAKHAANIVGCLADAAANMCQTFFDSLSERNSRALRRAGENGMALMKEPVCGVTSLVAAEKTAT
jgi:hypothetical protein